MKTLTLVALITTLYSVCLKAQKLPDVQQASMRADTKEVKIDGNLNEWGHQLNVYNKATEYIIA